MPGGHEVLLTRRHFLYGAAGVAALAAVGGGAAWAAGRSSDDDALKTLKVPESAVTAQTALEEMENYEDAVTLAGSAKLPFGTLVWCSDDAVAACLLPTETAKPLAEVGLLDLSSAECTTIIEHAVGEAEGFEIYDVRANAAGVVWTEADILDNLWRVYAASLSGTTLGEPQLLDEGDVNWEMPTLAVADGYAFWQRLPQLDGNARVEDSRLLRAAFGTADSQVVYASQGRMACAPTSCGDSLALAPRARTSGTYYQLTHLDAATGEVTDACVLPSSMKPMECGWGKTGFSFAFDGIYNYGEGIANLGTYLPMEAPAAVSLTAANTEEMASEGGEADGGAPYLPVTCANPGTETYSAVPWFHFAANPLSAPCWCGDWLMVRGGSFVVAVDLAGRRYAQLPLEEGSGDYNDFLASTHAGTRAVTYCNVDYTPIGGEQQKHCLVRIWEPAA
ncbi:twin-arginine translocation signal domain-containing protein [Adlercreutzia equolifaciens]|uniref:Twin-arginine translocation signal domain-containing protein n=1 Tax=Adlercreutzia rubneri TaxID=2916441 RepID=A0A7K1T559_9ACTN|nr:twin-arginine translocation signal domain-containing protein [Adlercreutzia rubneri]